MSKKKERIKYLIGIHNALKECQVGADGLRCYSPEKVSSVLGAVKHLLAEDGINPVIAAGRVES